VLDPIVAIRHRITLDPGASATVDIVSGVGRNPRRCLKPVGNQDGMRLAIALRSGVAHTARWSAAAHATEADTHSTDTLPGAVIYANRLLRAEQAFSARPPRPIGLWGYSIPGDLPIVRFRLQSSGNAIWYASWSRPTAYWRLKGLAVDLVLWNEDHAGYRQLLHEQIMGADCRRH